jgi:hypothetical protein
LHRWGAYCAARMSMMGFKVGDKPLALAYVDGDMEAIEIVHDRPSLGYWLSFFQSRDNWDYFNGGTFVPSSFRH